MSRFECSVKGYEEAVEWLEGEGVSVDMKDSYLTLHKANMLYEQKEIEKEFAEEQNDAPK